jgi:hypothetical protein
MRLGTLTIRFEDDPAENPEQIIASTRPASTESVLTVLAGDPDGYDGRSEWLWIRLANGDLILGVFPQGETYFATENDHNR